MTMMSYIFRYKKATDLSTFFNLFVILTEGAAKTKYVFFLCL